ALGLGPRLVEAQMQAVAPRVQSVEAVAQIRAALRVPHGAVHGVDAAACRIAASRESPGSAGLRILAIFLVGHRVRDRAAGVLTQGPVVGSGLSTGADHVLDAPRDHQHLATEGQALVTITDPADDGGQSGPLEVAVPADRLRADLSVAIQLHL